MNTNFYSKYLKYKNKYLKLKGGSFETPICTNQGFSQHLGECWHDALSMALLYSDGFKEETQPLLYNNSVEELIKYGMLKENNRWVHIPLIVNIKKELTGKYLTLTTEYLTVLQERFKKHYDNYKKYETSRLKDTQEETKYVDLYELQGRREQIVERQKSSDLGIKSAVCAYKIGILDKEIDPDLVQSKHGGNDSKINTVVDVFNQFLFRNKYIYPYFVSDNKLINKEMVDSALSMIVICETPSDKHAISCYTCNGESVIYDNNIGIKNFDWKDYLLKLENADSFGYYKIADNKLLNPTTPQRITEINNKVEKILLLFKSERDYLHPIDKLQSYVSIYNDTGVFTRDHDIIQYFNYIDYYHEDLTKVRPAQTYDWYYILLVCIEKMNDKKYYLYTLISELLRIPEKNKNWKSTKDYTRIIIYLMKTLKFNSYMNQKIFNLLLLLSNEEHVITNSFNKSILLSTKLSTYLLPKIIIHPNHVLVDYAIKNKINDYIYSLFQINYNWDEYYNNTDKHIDDVECQYNFNKHHPFALAIIYKNYELQKYFESTFDREYLKLTSVLHDLYKKHDAWYFMGEQKKARDENARKEAARRIEENKKLIHKIIQLISDKYYYLFEAITNDNKDMIDYQEQIINTLESQIKELYTDVFIGTELENLEKYKNIQLKRLLNEIYIKNETKIELSREWGLQQKVTEYTRINDLIRQKIESL